MRTAPAAMVATARLGIFFPMIPLIRNPTRGNKGIIQIESRKFIEGLPLHEIDFVDVHGFLVLEHRDHDPQSHSGFRRCNGNYKDGEYLSGHLLQTSGKSNQVDV